MNNSLIDYCYNSFFYKRRLTREVSVGDVGIGGSNPVRIQSMTTSPTINTADTVTQIKELAEAGCEIVRVTVPSIKEAENLKAIREQLKKNNIRIPLVADIHFTPNAAMKAVEYVEKIRINPGNFADKKQFSHFEYTEQEYQRELDRIGELFKPLILRCRELGVAMRIGVNHGSLSDRIMSRYGDTPEGMVESAVEFIRIAERYGYGDIVLSMKASNPKIMTGAYRLLSARMSELNMDYPFHLGVTEAGEGEDGRIKSAVGIGSLLEDGIGDTIRVSLTEDSVKEIPAARAIADKYHYPMPGFSGGPLSVSDSRNAIAPERRTCRSVKFGPLLIGGQNPVRVMASEHNRILSESAGITINDTQFPVESVRFNILDSHSISVLKNYSVSEKKSPLTRVVQLEADADLLDEVIPHADVFSVLPAVSLNQTEWNEQLKNIFRILEKNEKTFELLIARPIMPEFIKSSTPIWPEQIKKFLEIVFSISAGTKLSGQYIMISDPALIYTARFVTAVINNMGMDIPVGLLYKADDYREEHIKTSVHAPVILGSLLCDGIGDLICISDERMPDDDLIRLNYNILQASRARISKAEVISCPSCGRTQFDIQAALARIKKQTSHLTGVKIAVMGCIVNGLGEMADADFGFVGAQAGKVNLYYGKTLVKRNVPMEDADHELIALIRQYGYWKDP